MVIRFFPWLVGLAVPVVTLAQGGAPGASRYALDTTAVEARYRVTERFAANTIDNEVVGVTRAVTGQVVLDVSGRPVANESRLTIVLTGLKTDRTRRDSYVQKNTLETAKWPSAELTVRELRGLPAPLPGSGTFDVVVVGELALHGVTRPTTWSAKVTLTAGVVRGSAKATIRFADFGMPVPKVPLIARVDDPITLELDFTFLRPVDPNDR
jgi:polyisoprenoid-binding protein YceI